MVPLLKYTVLRLALFVGALFLLTLLGAGQLGALIGAAVISFLLSYILLRGPREQLAVQIAERVDRRHGPTDAEADAALEDAADEARRATAPPTD